MGTIEHPQLRDFADRDGVALVSVLGNPIQRGFYPVSAIDDDIRRLGQLLHHPELSTLPFFSFGHSNGTGFAGSFASQRPDRAIAWISYHSGAAFHLQVPGVEKVPGLAMHGQIDPFSHNGQEQTIKNLRKQRNAPIALMMEGNVAHGPVDKDKNATWNFIVQFCEAAMRIRLNPGGTLRPIVIEQGWLGANYDRGRGGQQELAIAPYGEFQGDRSIANWLPDRQFAEVWQRYGKTDPRPVK
jgi:pimeloyl-ACP methyl ester carboxylesterase